MLFQHARLWRTHVSIRTDPFVSFRTTRALQDQLTRSRRRERFPAYRTLSQKLPNAPFRPRTRAVPPRDRQQLPRPPRPTMRQVASISPRACPTPCRPYPSKSDSRPSSWCEDLAGARARSRARGAATPARARALVAADLARSQQRPVRPSFCLLTLMLTLASRFYLLSSR